MRLGYALTITLGLLAGCATSASSSGPSRAWIIRNGGLSNDADAARACAIAGRFAGVVNKPFTVHVLRDDTPTAMAWPSGDIFLTSALTQMLTDDEVAAVIGHELGHLISDGHTNTNVSLTGKHDDDHAEILADDAGLNLMKHTLTPAQSLRSALYKIMSYQKLSGTNPSRLAARIARLP